MICYPTVVGTSLTRALEHGSGDDLVLFLHGVGARADRWRHNVQALGQNGRRCVALDLPGHGFAAKGANFNYSVDGYVEFVASYIRQWSPVRAHLVGTSLGAHISATVACRHPDLVAGLVLVGATGLFPIGPEAAGNIARRQVDRSREGIAVKLAHVFHDPSLVTPALVEEEFLINNSPGSDETFAALARYFVEGIDRDVIGPELARKSSALPIMAIWGESDRTVPLELGRRAAALLGNIPLEVIGASAHVPYLERPELFNPLVARFLDHSVARAKN